MDVEQLQVNHNEKDQRFEVGLEDKLALLEYRIAGKNIIFTHTEVPEEFSGMGIANKLASVALEYAKTQGYKIQAICPFVFAYIRKHPEYHAITWGYDKKKE